MKIEVWSFRTQPWPGSPASASLARWGGGRFVVAAAALVLSLSTPLLAQSLREVEENGHVVWTNDTPLEAGDPSIDTHPELAYWSNVEKRWKPIRPRSAQAMRSARAVAGEVSRYIQSRPALDGADAAQRKIKGELAAEDPNYSQAAGDRSVSTAQIDHYINEAAARHHVNPNLVRALIKVESNFNPRALSPKGAMGLMQLMPATARRYQVSNPFDIRQNVEAGVRHLKGLLEDFGGDVRLSLAAYNAGEGAVARSGGIPPYTETRNYVKRITGMMVGNSAAESAPVASASVPITLRRDERGVLIISNTD